MGLADAGRAEQDDVLFAGNEAQLVQVEDLATVVTRIREALRYVSPDRLLLAPDCGMKYLPREVALAKMKAMVEGAKLMRAEFDRTQ